MSAGQMLEDVKRIVNKVEKIRFFGCMGGVIPMVEDVVLRITDLDKAFNRISALPEDKNW
jgi:hypothetical protein